MADTTAVLDLLLTARYVGGPAFRAMKGDLVELVGASNGLERMGAAFRMAGDAMMTGGLAAAVGLGAAVKEAMDYTDAVNRIQAVTDLSSTKMANWHGSIDLTTQKLIRGKTELQAYNDEVAKAAVQWGIMPTTIAKGSYYLFSILGALKLKPSDILKSGMIGDLAAYSRASGPASGGGVSYDQAAQVLPRIFGAYNMPINQWGGGLGLLTYLENNAHMTQQQMVSALASYVPVAGALGMPFSDSATLIAALASSGVVGSTAGTRLASGLTLMLGGKTQRAALAQMGLSPDSFFNKKTGKILPADQMLGVLYGQISKLSPEQRLPALHSILGMVGMKAYGPLFDSGWGRYQNLLADEKKSGVTSPLQARLYMMGVAGKMMNSPVAKLESLGAALALLGITIGQKVMPYVMRFVDWLTKVALTLTTIVNGTAKGGIAGLLAKGFQSPHVGAMLAALPFALLGGGGLLHAAGTGLGFLGATSKALNKKTGFGLGTHILTYLLGGGPMGGGPMLPLLHGYGGGGLLGRFMMPGHRMGMGRTPFQWMEDFFSTGGIGGRFLPRFSFAHRMAPHWTSGLSGAARFDRMFFHHAKGLGGDLAHYIASAPGALGRGIGMAGAGIGKGVSNLNPVVGIPKLLNFINPLTRIPQLFGLIGKAVLGIGPAFISLLGAALPVIAILLAVAGIVVIVVLAFTRFRAQTMAVVNMIAGTMRPVFQTIGRIIGQVVGQIQAQWNKAAPTINKAMGQLMSAMLKAKPVFVVIGAVIGFVVMTIVAVVGALVSAFISALPGIIGFFTGIIQIITTVATIIIDLFTGKWGEIPGLIMQLFGQIIGTIFQGLGTILGFIKDFVGNFIGFFINLFETLVGHSIIPDMVMAIIRWIALMPVRILATIAGFVINLVKMWINLEVQVVKAVIDMVGKVIAQILQWRNAGIQLIAGFIQGFLQKLQEAKQLAVQGFQNLVNAVKNFLGIHSPSTVFSNMGQMSGDGYAMGLLSTKDKAAKAGTTVANAAATSLQSKQNMDQAYQAGEDIIQALESGMYAQQIHLDIMANANILAGQKRYGKGGAPHFASGGTMPYTGMALVGEEGPELIKLGAGSQVFNHQDTRALLRPFSNGPLRVNELHVANLRLPDGAFAGAREETRRPAQQSRPIAPEMAFARSVQARREQLIDEYQRRSNFDFEYRYGYQWTR